MSAASSRSKSLTGTESGPCGLLTAADRPSVWDGHLSRAADSPYTSPDPRSLDREHRQTIPEQMGTAKR